MQQKRSIQRKLKRVLGPLGFLRALHSMRGAWESIKRVRTHWRKQTALREYQRRFGLSTLVETGTYRGDMVEAMRGTFSRIHSIELGEELFQKAKARFAETPSITIHHGDSGEILASLLVTLEGPVLFWLDAHYSRGDTALGRLETPIEKELANIFAHEHRHVILIDDAQYFNGTGDYPTLDHVRNLVAKAKHTYKFSVRDDIIRIIPE